MPSRLHAVYARLVPRLRKAGEMQGDEPAERARVRPGTRPWTAACRRAPCAGSTATTPWCARSWPASRRTSSRHGRRRRRARCSTCTVAGTWRRSVAGRSGTPPGWRRRSAPASCCPTTRSRPSTRGATATTRSRAWRSGGRAEGGIVLAGDSSGGGYALALALTLRDRGGPPPTHLVLHAPWVDLTTSTPETRGVRRGRPVAVHRQDAHVRRVVGGVARGPRPPRGQPGAGRPLRAAPRADVLRHPRPARAGLPAARPREPRPPAGT